MCGALHCSAATTNATTAAVDVFMYPVSFRTQFIDGSLPLYSRWQAFVDCGGALAMLVALYVALLWLVGLVCHRPSLRLQDDGPAYTPMTAM